MTRIKTVLDIFTKVTTGVVLGAASYCLLFFPGEPLHPHMLWQLLLIAFLTSAGTLLYTDDIQKNNMKICCFIHYLLVNVITIGGGAWFGWFSLNNPAQVIGMVLIIALIFAVVSVVSWKKASKEAELMNQRLAEYQEKSESDD